MYVEVIEAAKNTSYGLACHVFSENINRALRVTHEMEAGTVWVCHFPKSNVLLDLLRSIHARPIAQLSQRSQCPGAGTSNPASVANSARTRLLRSFLSFELQTAMRQADCFVRYTQVKAVHVNLGAKL